MTPPPFTVIGTPFSTFTRTITLALTYKGIAFNQVRIVPHSDTAHEHHSFGFLPTLLIHELNGQKADLKPRESQAITRPTLTITDGDGHAAVAEQMWEFVSFVRAYGFPAVEKSVVKLRVAAIDQGTLSDAKVRCTIAPAVAQFRTFLDNIEAHMFPEGYVFGEKLSWADLFLYPLLAHLRAIPEGEILSPRLVEWMDKMDRLDAVEESRAGTLSVAHHSLIEVDGMQYTPCIQSTLAGMWMMSYEFSLPPFEN
ncbi:hypothetical protein L210DRAFT_3613154 [Boletus edulis BED1]|uniref:GST N-terminal domain-containing protein n=1 Tax=Boletus edulis BED1 TaxID=1328754 RepID=A0AAD4BR71_BOLED|nr:hypothetical protein L210DRAFT_3617304 [Boletus edulis BED1]KAF8437710.1 hypothetical protein L210DRAFT_3613154 [Boletus edulis BED1]